MIVPIVKIWKFQVDIDKDKNIILQNIYLRENVIFL